jgi:Flp pilus assembly protein TadG
MLTGDALKADGDAGSIAVFTAFFAFAVLLLLAVLVDGGSALNARERAADVAEQAARSAVTDLSTDDLQAGTVAVDWATACGYAQQTVGDYSATFKDVTAADMTSCGEGANAQTATVTVTLTTQPAIPGFPAMTMTATQSASAVCGNADQEEDC